VLAISNSSLHIRTKIFWIRKAVVLLRFFVDLTPRLTFSLVGRKFYTGSALSYSSDLNLYSMQFVY